MSNSISPDSVRGLLSLFGDADARARQGATVQALIETTELLLASHEKLRIDLDRALARQLQLVAWPCGHFSKPHEFCPICGDMLAKSAMAIDRIHVGIQDIILKERFENSERMRKHRQGEFPVHWHLSRYVDNFLDRSVHHVVVDKAFKEGDFERFAGQPLCNGGAYPDDMEHESRIDQIKGEPTCTACMTIYRRMVERSYEP